MPRNHEAFEGTMNASAEGDPGHEQHPVEVRILRGVNPGTISILLPNAVRSRKVKGQDGGYDWTDPHQVDNVPIEELVNALVGLGQLEKLPDGSFRVAENPPFGK